MIWDRNTKILVALICLLLANSVSIAVAAVQTMAYLDLFSLGFLDTEAMIIFRLGLYGVTLVMTVFSSRLVYGKFETILWGKVGAVAWLIGAVLGLIVDLIENYSVDWDIIQSVDAFFAGVGQFSAPVACVIALIMIVRYLSVRQEM